MNDNPYRSVLTDRFARLPFPPYAPVAPGAALGFTRALYERLGGFDPEFQPEDDDFCVRAWLAGFDLHLVSSAVINYRLRSELRDIFWQAYGYSRADVQLAKRYAHTGRPLRRRWRTLARRAASAIVRFAQWRLGPGRSDMREAVRVHRKAAHVLGQFTAIWEFRAAPSMGVRAEDAEPPPRGAPAERPTFS